MIRTYLSMFSDVIGGIQNLLQPHRNHTLHRNHENTPSPSQFPSTDPIRLSPAGLFLDSLIAVSFPLL